MVSMIRMTQKVRIYPEPEQQQQLARAMGCCRWWWNRALNISNQTYIDTGKSVSRNTKCHVTQAQTRV